MDTAEGTDTLTGARTLAPGMRRILNVAGTLVFLAGIQLFVLSTATDRFFAWTIGVPLTAAFLGAGYWASVALEWLAAREKTWAYARVAVPAVFVFTTLTTVVTFLHLDLFHLDASIPFFTRLVTWGWIAIYVLVPPALLLILVKQARLPGGDPPRDQPLPVWLRTILGLHAATMAALGLALFIAPETTASLWPWPLTPLTARAVAAWLLGLSVAAGQSAWENDTTRVRLAFISYTVLGVLQLVAVARFSDAVAFSEPKAWIYLGFLASLVGVGLYGWLGLRPRS